MDTMSYLSEFEGNGTM